MSTQDVLIDPWTWLDHKPTFGVRAKATFLAPMWVGDHFRRLQAYRLLDSYYMNSARNWMDSSMDEDTRADRREYGDPHTVIDQIATSLIGDDQSIMPLVGEADMEAARPQVEQMMEWATKENFFLKLLEFETMANKLGDAVYVLGWDPSVNRPKITVWDPGFYFPVLDPREVTDAFPDRVHIAYEYEEEDSTGAMRKYVRRITWEILETENEIAYPWNEGTVRKACFMTDATWRVDDQKNNVDDFDYSKATFADYEDPDTGEIVPWDDIDIGIDFIPVVHCPNTPAGLTHYGVSSMSPVIQILDDLISTDTDLQAASATTGTPPIALSGSSAPKDDDGRISTYGPGTVFETGDGKATMIDTSRSLDALIKYKDALLERLSVNGRVPESLLGRVKPNEVPSGIALTLSFAPHSSMVQQMRMVRDVKYRILLKFVARMFQIFGDWPADDIVPMTIKFGSFLPADKKETVDLVVQLLASKSISTQTAVTMLLEAGFPIEDAGAEVERIRHENFEAAEALINATGDADAVREFLGLGAREPLKPGDVDPATGLPVVDPTQFVPEDDEDEDDEDPVPPTNE